MSNPTYRTWWVRGKKDSECPDTFIDIEDFAARIMEACNALAADGYDVVHITDVIHGNYRYATRELENKNPGLFQGSTWGGGWGYGYGYSVTDGVVITARLRNV